MVIQMEDKFYNYLISIGRKPNTAYSYKNAINQISKHYSEREQQQINVYVVIDPTKISEIAKSYRQDGIYSKAGNTGNGTWRNAIARYSEFFENQSVPIVGVEHSDNPNSSEELDGQEQQVNCAERVLQRALCSQVAELFPGYKIYGENKQGIEYGIGNRRIDILLEHLETSDLLVVELKSGEADYRVFGQISMYMGLLQDKFS